MSLESTQIAKIGTLASAGLTLVNPVLGLAAGAATTFFAAQASADEQREFSERSAKINEEIAARNEARQRRTNQAVQGRIQGRMASSGFTTRGTPIEVFANTVADQEEEVLIRRFEARAGIQDSRIRAEYGARQTEAQGFAGLASGLGAAGQTILSKIQPSSFFEEA